MTKIKSIKQLRAEKKRIAQHQQELEQKIQLRWNEFKSSLTPANIASHAFDAINSKPQQTNTGNTILKGVLSIGATLLAKKLATKTGEKLGSMFHKN